MLPIYRIVGRSILGMLFRAFATILFWLFVALLRRVFQIRVTRKQSPPENPFGNMNPKPERNRQPSSNKQEISDAEWHQL